MKHYGDITKLSGYELHVVDVIVGGSPCQDLSVAGKRAGLAGERSGLFMEQMRIIKEMREEDGRTGRASDMVRPRHLIWENVPGCQSSGTPKGADFQAVLQEICKVVCKEAPPVPIPKEGWPKAGSLCGVGDNGIPFSICWRIHDSQWWGVPQRRKRICICADFNGLSAPYILFDPQLRRAAEGGEQDEAVGDLGNRNRWSVSALSEGLPRDSEQGGTEGQGTSNGTERGVASTITATYGTKWNGNAGAFSGGNFAIEKEPMPIEGNGSRESHRGDGYGASGDPSFTLNGTEHHGVAYGISSFDSNAMKSPNPHSGIYKADSSRTLDLTGGSPACNQGGVAVVQAVDCRNCTENSDVNGTLQGKPSGGASLNTNIVIRECC